MSSSTSSRPLPSPRQALRLALVLLAWALLSWGLGYTVQQAAGPVSAGGKAAAWAVADAAQAGTVSVRLQLGPPTPGWRAWASPATPGSGFGKSLLEDSSLSPDLDPEMPEHAMPSTVPAVRVEAPKVQPCAPPVAVVIAPPQRLFRPPNLG